MQKIESKQAGVGVVLTIIGLDAAGIGLTLPILPRLLSEVAHTTELGWRFGAFLSLYALMQFLFSPVLGVWSDKIGRRPTMLGCLGGVAAVVLVCGRRRDAWEALKALLGDRLSVSAAVRSGSALPSAP